MRFLTGLLALASTLLYVQAQNVVCPTGTSTKTVTITDGSSYSFKTHKGKKYKGNTDCTVDYVIGETCAKMSFICTKFSTNNKDKKRCRKGDTMTVTANGKTKKYCKTKKPKITSSGDITVVFTSDAKKAGTGAICKVKCTEAVTESTTPESTTSGVTGIPCGPGSTERCIPPLEFLCPDERPEFGSNCSSSMDGRTCYYGNQTCCGERSAEYGMECGAGQWNGYYIDTVCILGLPCPTKAPTTTVPSCICPAVVIPVCGTDEQTYSNSCQAQCQGVAVGCQGDCPCPNTSCLCPPVVIPVCGTDGQTYSNFCEASCQGVALGCQGDCPCQ